MVVVAPSGGSLDQQFWRQFAKRHWEKKSLLLRKPNLNLLNEGEVFELLQRFSDLCRTRGCAEGIKFYIDGQRLHEEEVLQFLPLKRDVSLVGYHTRMNKLFSDYCLVCDELLQVMSNKEHGCILGFLHDLYDQVGFPNRFAEMGLYLGNYRKTPFGVHVDGCGVFSFPVIGKKKFRLWSAAFGRRNPKLDQSFSYSQYKKQSSLLAAEPGDLVYWPSSAWHIAESDGRFNATWSLGVWVDRTHNDVVADTMKELLAAKLGTAGARSTVGYELTHSRDGEIAQLPELYAETIRVLQALSSEELNNAFLQTWMSQVSGQGLKSAPKVIPIKELTLRSQVQLMCPKALVLWCQLKTKMYYSYGGLSCEGPKSTGMAKLLKAINSGQVCRINEFLSGRTTTFDLKVLQVIAEAGAFGGQKHQN